MCAGRSVRAQTSRCLRARRRLSSDELPDGVLVLDADGTVPLANEAARRLLQLQGQRSDP